MGPLEFGLIALLILLLFGSKRLPNLGNALGEATGVLRRQTETKVDAEER